MIGKQQCLFELKEKDAAAPSYKQDAATQGEVIVHTVDENYFRASNEEFKLQKFYILLIFLKEQNYCSHGKLPNQRAESTTESGEWVDK